MSTRTLLARVVRPEIGVAAFAFLLPDLIDKPLRVLGLASCGRFIGHTLLVAVLVAVAFSLKKRIYGLFAIAGSMTHLLLDSEGFVPWFYPFKGYDFPVVDYRGVYTWQAVAGTLLEMVIFVILLAAVVFVVLSLSSRLKARRCPKLTGPAGHSAGTGEEEP